MHLAKKDECTEAFNAHGKYIQHQMLIESSKQQFEVNKASQDSNTCIVVQDFASGYEVVNRADETTNDF